MLICLEILRVKHIKIKASWWVAFIDVRKISNYSPFISKPTQKIDDKQVTEYDFDK